jgi:RNA polymerase sigma-70 factor (ECF subfamily)
MSYVSYTDEVLFSLLKEEDHDAFTEIYNRYSGILYAHILKRLRDSEEAMDIVQELFTHLWQKKEEIVITSYFSGYLYTSARNRVINKIAHKDISSKYYDFKKSSSHYSVTSSTDHLVRERQLSEIIEKEISFLPERMREVFELSRFQHLSHREIADRLNITELTVKKQVNKALRILRIKLDLFILFMVLLFS